MQIHPTKVKKIMEQSFLNYAMSVISDRALPDVRDGLKPVHRRILYAMFDAGNTQNKAYRKSARMVGDVIGKYHPHGDVSVYDAAVRMAQPFSMNHLLIDGQGNFGSVDGDNPAAMRYCFVAGTRVITEKGFLPIEQIPSAYGITEDLRQQSGISVKINASCTSLGGAGKAHHWVNSGIQDVVEVVTKNGYKTVCTPNEPFLVLDRDLNLVWREAQHLCEDDRVCMSTDTGINIPEGCLLPDFHWDANSKAKRYITPTKMSESLSRILGLLVSDGTFRSTNNEIIFGNSDRDIIEQYQKDMAQNFPDLKTIEREMPQSVSGFAMTKPSWQVSFSSLYISKWFQDVLGFKPFKSDTVTIPEIIFRSGRNEVAAFLRAYYEGDGSICKSGISGYIRAISNSVKLLEDIKILLIGHFGILSGRISPSRSGYMVQISGHDNLQRFSESIGFCSQRKNDSLSCVVASCEAMTQGSPSRIDSIPHVGDVISAEFSCLTESVVNGSSNMFRGRFPGDISKIPQNRWLLEKWLSNILQKHPYLADFPVFKKLSGLLDASMAFFPVLSVTPCGKEWVYDLTVTPAHAFCANGFIVHNTEMRLTTLSGLMFEDIRKDTVPFLPNYDGSEQEPSVLTTPFPTLLVNGTDGIAVGMASSIPPHNLRDVAKTVHILCHDPETSAVELYHILQAPDFPTGGIVYHTEGMLDAIETGRGKVRLRAKWHAEERNRGSRIVVDEIPYQVNKANLVIAIADLVRDKEIEDIVGLRDESNKDGMRVVIDLRAGADPEVVFAQLATRTNLDVSLSYNCTVLDKGTPKLLGLRDMLLAWIAFRKETILCRTLFERKNALARLHILDGLMAAMDHLDAVIALIRGAASLEIARDKLMNLLSIDELQTRAILDMRLQKLTGMELSALREEHARVSTHITELTGLIDSPESIQSVLLEELDAVANRYGQDRRTEVGEGLSNMNREDLVTREEVLIAMTRSGYVKRMPASVLSAQNRGTRGKRAITMGDGDDISALIQCHSHDMLLLFTVSGQALGAKAWQLPEGNATSAGRHLRNVFDGLDEEIVAVVQVPEDSQDWSVVAVTSQGQVKRTDMTEYTGATRKGGISGIRLEEGDMLVDLFMVRPHDHLMMISSGGRAIRFDIEDVRATGRVTGGMRGMRIGTGEKILGATVVPSNGQPLPSITITEEDGSTTETLDTSAMDAGRFLVCVGANGVGKRTSLSEFRVQSRSGKGMIAFRPNQKTGSLVAALGVEESDDLVFFASNGVSNRIHVEDVRETGRNASGVYLMNMDTGALVTRVVKAVRQNEEAVAEDIA